MIDPSKKPKGRWNKYNVKSLKVDRGKEGSQYYQYLISVYEIEEANRRYKLFKYQITHGQENFNK